MFDHGDALKEQLGGGSDGKVPAMHNTCSSCGFNPWVRKIPWRRKWQPTPVFLPGESHGRRSLVGYSPRGRKELDTTKHTNTRHARFDENLNKINLTYSRPPR